MSVILAVNCSAVLALSRDSINKSKVAHTQCLDVGLIEFWTVAIDVKLIVLPCLA